MGWAIIIGAVIVGAINRLLHISTDKTSNNWHRLGYWAQGALAGACLGVLWWGGIILFLQGNALGIIFISIKGLEVLLTLASFLRNPSLSVKILLGRYYFDDFLAHGLMQACSRFSWEALQTFIGYCASQCRNLAGHVSRVDYLNGATVATLEHSPHHQGFTIGNTINMSIPDNISIPFHQWHLHSCRMILHEYGHTLQSQILGPFYLPIVGLPSLLSAAHNKILPNDPLSASTHSYFFTETWANRLSSKHFQNHLGLLWCETGYPLHNYRNPNQLPANDHSPSKPTVG